MQLEVGTIVEGKVTGITKFGVFVDLGDNRSGMVHISEVSTTYVKEISDFIKMGDVVKVKVLNIGDDGKIGLSIKRAMDPKPQSSRPHSGGAFHGGPQGGPPRRRSQGGGGTYTWQPKAPQKEALTFEDMMAKFKATSDEKMNDLKRSVDSKRGSGPRKGSK